MLEDLKKANKGIIQLNQTFTIVIPLLKGKQEIEIFYDTGIRNLPDQITSGRGCVLFLKGENGSYAFLAWVSKNIKRVARSTIAAEALSMRAPLDNRFFLGVLLAEILRIYMLEIKKTSNTDSNTLFSAICSTIFAEDKKNGLTLHR